MAQLNLFSEYQPPHIKLWEGTQKGWRPRRGQIGRICGLVWRYGDELIPENLRGYQATMMTCYILDVTEYYVEVMLPYLKGKPWCHQQHLIAPLSSIEAQIHYGFDERQWRDDNPIR